MKTVVNTGRHEPQRTCIGCRTRGPARTLVRFALCDERVVLDNRRRLPGRGAWLCPQPACLHRAISRNAFARAFRRSLLPIEAETLVDALDGLQPTDDSIAAQTPTGRFSEPSGESRGA